MGGPRAGLPLVPHLSFQVRPPGRFVGVAAATVSLAEQDAVEPQASKGRWWRH
ncbi:hypothetical protein [Providencia stuartii]|uniref:hypothetical protein n=1 Tax=Providencia stuartii TaxID=588 RepID=UPI0018C50FEA|nr:hypothetical protein [Providencia stuartii]MBG5918504.1 hypothetical protein [Providencia stuartii]